ncbi:IWS1 C-terminus protein [Toxoplasma gondii TgCatPRC2]|uniref:IWS1 C-terminus protein n=2 Tax=Toxoplasma gondii TaxID=5811 RepID=A0A151H6Q2_TOXGO|nr:IWS1 transcription factor, putative [Toxoplasma gondii ME49]EPT27235.1 IWS1 transcription factor, putative [Toxoplasma gondii ME49]KYK65012.1 IWS1 C-terminus protein [Toxoplasma gondii TgCatPRC2]|eukprot:XP_002366389.1 IWS1 transcription factor, putative [Toxoplasma gondii ME49]
MADAGDEGDALRANAGESPRPFPESANGGMESLTDEEDFLNKTPTGDVNPEDLQEERAEREGDVETRSHEPPSGLFGDERDEIELGGTEREVSREEARRLKKEKKKRKKEKKEKKEKKKKRKRDQEGDDGEAEREKARLGGQNSGFLDDDDETLGGFIERDPEAAIHEAEDERIHVQGGINSDNDRSDIEDYGEHEGTHRPLTEFDKTLERMRQRKRRRQPLSDQDCQAYCNSLLQQMSDASTHDEKALEEGKPATAKLEMLDRVCTELVKPKWRSWFLTEGCCQCIATWLAPFKDNTLSNFTLRNRLLHVLMKLPISSQELMNNDLGRVLVLLWHHPDESDENRVLIRQLIQRWTRPMLGLGSSHREFLQERDRAFEANDADIQQKLIAAAKALQAARPPADDPEEARRRHARIPVNSGHNFIIQPKSDVNSNEQPRSREAGGSQNARSLHRFMDARSVRKPTRAQKVSIEGRGL